MTNKIAEALRAALDEMDVHLPSEGCDTCNDLREQIKAAIPLAEAAMQVIIAAKHVNKIQHKWWGQVCIPTGARENLANALTAYDVVDRGRHDPMRH